MDIAAALMAEDESAFETSLTAEAQQLEAAAEGWEPCQADEDDPAYEYRQLAERRLRRARER